MNPQRLDTTIIAIMLIACHHVNGISRNAHQNEDKHERIKRFVPFLKTTGIGYLVALAIPTSAVNRQRVYMAFNFEAHYGVADADTFLAKLKMPFPGDDISQVKRDIHGLMSPNERNRRAPESKNVYTRKNFYRILEEHIDSYGYNGTSCLLRTICETAEIPLYENNGIFGNLVHILFTPSASESENIWPEYYEAEYHGQLQECHQYQNQCDISLLDLASDVISIELRKMM